jgi:hypothetical protein
MSDEQGTQAEAEATLQAAINDAKAEGHSEASISALESRLSALEARGDPDLSPVVSRVDSLSESLTGSLSDVLARLAAIESRSDLRTDTSARQETAVKPEPEPSLEIPPQIDVKAASRTRIHERVPKVPHVLFRRIGSR